jgi:hypothetical protein
MKKGQASGVGMNDSSVVLRESSSRLRKFVPDAARPCHCEAAKPPKHPPDGRLLRRQAGAGLLAMTNRRPVPVGYELSKISTRRSHSPDRGEVERERRQQRRS